MKKVLLCAFLLFLSITLYTVGISYGLFETEYTESMKIDLAKWQIKINGTLSKTVTTELVIDSFVPNGSNDSAPGTMAPGGAGYFEIELDPNDTETSFRYDIYYDFDSMGNTAIEISNVTVNNGYTLTNTSYNTYSGVMLYEDIINPTSVNPTIRVTIRWINDDNNNEEDSKYMDGSTKLRIPITIKLTQYLGETLDYEETVLYNKLANLAESDSGMDYTGVTGSGLYELSSTSSYTNPVYYFRGNPLDNNVIFNGLCYKILRTTDTGGVKLAYAGTPINGVCNNNGGNVFIGTDKYNSDDLASALAGVGFSYGDYHKLKTINTPNTAFYGNNVSYSSVNKQYSVSDFVTIAKENVSGNTDIPSHGYTCLANTSKCEKVNYIVSLSNDGSQIYAIELEQGQKIENIISSNVINSGNGYNSIVHDLLDIWFENNLLSVKGKLEDTPYCNSRNSTDNGVWNINASDYSVFKFQSNNNNNSISLTCGTNDGFTVNSSSGNKKSKYPIGLITVEEYKLSGANSTDETTNYLNTGYDYWTMTPSSFDRRDAKVFAIGANGLIIEKAVNLSLGIRPVITLKANTTTIVGDGTSDNPYVIR